MTLYYTNKDLEKGLGGAGRPIEESVQSTSFDKLYSDRGARIHNPNNSTDDFDMMFFKSGDIIHSADWMRKFSNTKP